MPSRPGASSTSPDSSTRSSCRTTAAASAELSGGAAYGAGIAALGALMHPGGRAAKRLRFEKPAYADRIDGKAAILRRDGWCVALTGRHDPRRQGNGHVLDRTQTVSVFHDACGVVIGGGNDKNHFDAATFEVLESGPVHCFPSIDERRVVVRRL
jgi:hypothetical protein